MAWVASESNSFVSGDMGSGLDKELGDLTFFYSLEIFEDFSESIFFGCLFNFFKIEDCFLLCLSDFVFIFAWVIDFVADFAFFEVWTKDFFAKILAFGVTDAISSAFSSSI